MSRITTKFESDDSSALKAIDRLNKTMDKLIGTSRKLVESSKESGAAGVAAAHEHTQALANLQRETLKLAAKEKTRADDSKRQGGELRQMVSGQIADLKSMVLQYGSVTAAVGFVVSAYREWRQEMERLGEASDKLNKSTIKDLALGGDLANAPAFLERQREHPTATPEQVGAAQRGVRGAAPSLPVARVLDIADEAARAAPLFRDDPAALQKLAEAAGEIADTLPDLKPADVVDLAFSLQQKAGADFEKVADPSFQRATKILRETGAVDATEALSLGVEALDANIDPKSIEKLAAKLTEQKKVPPIPAGRALTDSDKLLRAFAQEKDAAKRLEMLRSNEGLQQKVLGDQLANKFREINFDKAFQRAQVLRKDMGRDYVGEQVGELRRTPEGQEAVERQAVDRQRAETRQQKEEAGRQTKDIEDKLEAMLERLGFNWIDSAIERLHFGMAMGVGGVSGKSPVDVFEDFAKRGLGTTKIGEVTDPDLQDFIAEQRSILERQKVRRDARQPGMQAPIIEQPLPEAPPRPKFELPPAPEPREPRQPAPLGQTPEERRRAFEQGQKPQAVEPRRPPVAELPPIPAFWPGGAANPDPQAVEPRRPLPPALTPAQAAAQAEHDSLMDRWRDLDRYKEPAAPMPARKPAPVAIEPRKPEPVAVEPRKPAAAPPVALELPPTRPLTESVDPRTKAQQRKDQGGFTNKEWQDMLDRNNAARAREEGRIPAAVPKLPDLSLDAPEVRPPRLPGLEIPPPSVRSPELEPLAIRPPRVQSPDLLAGSSRNLTAGREEREENLPSRPLRASVPMPDLSGLAERGRRQAVEPTEIKLPTPERAPSIAEQFAGIAEQIAAASQPAGNPLGGLVESLKSLVTVLTEGNSEQRTTRRALEQLTGGRPTGVNAAAAVRDFNSHSEVA
jgi:hypothetical protein